MSSKWQNLWQIWSKPCRPGFPCPSPGHGLHNDSSGDLVYLVGGESNPADVVHYPRIRRTMIKSHGRRSWVDWADLRDL